MPAKKRRSRLSGMLPESFVQDNAGGPWIYPPGWKAAFKLFAEITETGGVAEAVRIFDEVQSRARAALVPFPPVPQQKIEGSRTPEQDAILLGKYFAARHQGMTKAEAIAFLEPNKDRQPALARRIQRLYKDDNDLYKAARDDK